MPGKAPRVSVVVPVRNCREYIKEALSSICTQDFRDLEVVVVDDGSTDDDYSKLQQLDPRIRVERLEGCGVSIARNFGMKCSRGEFIAFLDADDVWFPGKLSAQVRYLDLHPDIGCVFGAFVRWMPDATGQFPDASTLVQDCSALHSCEKSRSGWIYTRLLTGLLVGMNTAVIRRKVYERLGGFDESMRIGEDYLFWLKVSRLYEMHALDGAIALYRIHASSAMSQVSTVNHQATLLKIATGRWGLRNPDGSQLPKPEFDFRVASAEFTHGYNHFWNGSARIARRAFRRSLRGGFRPVRSAVYYLAAIARSVTDRSRH